MWDGALLLGDDGCAMYWPLVVTGTHRGQVWNVTDVGAQPFGYTTADDGHREDGRQGREGAVDQADHRRLHPLQQERPLGHR